LFSITVVTTIGYGHIAPKTVTGMVVTMIYALIGIPLTLLTITNIGRAMATSFRFLYRNLLTILCCVCCRHSCVRSITSPSPGAEADQIELGDGGEDKGWENKAASPLSNWRKNISLLTYDMKVIERVTVPIPVTILLIAGYIGLGSLLFGIWEGWGALESAYFCFVTLSTIGFGDMVPGTDLKKEGAQMKLVFCSLYLFLGLAFLAMCFDLMQEGVKAIFRQIGRKIGIISAGSD